MKTFTQEQLNSIVAKETAPLKKLVADLERVKTELTAASAALTTERDTARAELTALQQKRAAESAAVRQSAIETQITTALYSARVIPEAVGDAAREFLRSAELEVSDEHVITGVTYGGKRLSAGEAAKAFLGERLWYAQPTGTGGAGTRAGTGRAPTHAIDPLHALPPGEAMTQAWNRK